MLKIRFAVKNDCAFIMSLIRELALYEKAENQVKITAENLEKDGFSEPALFQALICEWENQSIGYAIFYNRYSTWYGKTLHLEDLFILPEYRSRGFAKSVFAFLADYALNTNVKRLEWEVLDWNQPAVLLYQSIGAVIIDNWNLCKVTDIQAFKNNLRL